MQYYLYKTSSGWHWEVTDNNWVLRDNKPKKGTLLLEGYKSRASCLKAAQRTCKTMGFDFKVENV